MSIFIDRKFLLLVSSRLRNFKTKKEDLFNFSCNYCGDSQRNALKARGYIYRKADDYFYMCHNCNVSTNFAKFLQHTDQTLYEEYLLEKYLKKDFTQENKEIILSGKKPSEIMNRLKYCDFENLSINKLDPEHYARAYIENRKIPEKYWNEILYVEDFKIFMDDNFKDHGKELKEDDPRIVFFHTDCNGYITLVCGRSLNSKLRYVKVKISDHRKVFGYHRWSSDKTTYIVEGEFDSLFLDNALASGDSNLLGLAQYFPDIDPVLVFDNEPRNKEICREVRGAVDLGYKVVLLPDNLPGKDLNEMFCNGVDVKALVDKHIYQGLQAQVEFLKWRKC